MATLRLPINAWVLVLVSATGPLFTAGTATVTVPSTAAQPPPVTDPCDASDVLSMLSDNGVLSKDKDKHLARLVLGARIRSCSVLIDAALALVPAPYPPDATRYQPRRLERPPACSATPSIANVAPVTLYETLSMCVSFLKTLPTPPPLPLLYGGHAGTKALYAMSIGGDAPTNAFLALRLAQRLQNQFTVRQTYRVIAQPSWTLSAYQQQCLTDTSTAGAFVVLPTSAQYTSTNLLLAGHSWADVNVQVAVLRCDDRGLSFLEWASNAQTARDNRWNIPLGSLAAIVTAFFPIHQRSSTQTQNVVPPSPNPSPGAAYVSTIVSGDSWSSATANSAAVLVATSLLNSLSSVSLLQSQDNPSQQASAADTALGKALSSLKSDCTRDTPLNYCSWISN